MGDGQGLSERDKTFLFWASFLALVAAGFGFAFRVMLPDIWGKEFSITAQEVGEIAGAGLWPIAITMILFSLLVDRIGYKISMFCAFGLQAISVILTISARDVTVLWWACFFAGLGHGVVEAVINPLCAAVYRDQKTKMLNILHASWPGGIAAGGCIYLLANQFMSWRIIFVFMLLPIIAYGALFAMCRRFPVDERVEANVPMRDMLREFGGLGGMIGGFALEIIGFPQDAQVGQLADKTVNGLLFINGPLYIGIFVLGVIFMLMYRLNEKRHQEILTELEARRGTAIEDEGIEHPAVDSLSPLQRDRDRMTS